MTPPSPLPPSPSPPPPSPSPPLPPPSPPPPSPPPPSPLPPSPSPPPPSPPPPSPSPPPRTATLVYDGASCEGSDQGTYLDVFASAELCAPAAAEAGCSMFMFAAAYTSW